MSDGGNAHPARFLVARPHNRLAAAAGEHVDIAQVDHVGVDLVDDLEGVTEALGGFDPDRCEFGVPREMLLVPTPLAPEYAAPAVPVVEADATGVDGKHRGPGGEVTVQRCIGCRRGAVCPPIAQRVVAGMGHAEAEPVHGEHPVGLGPVEHRGPRLVRSVDDVDRESVIAQHTGERLRGCREVVAV